MTTADKLIQLNTDLGTINDEVTNQADLISLVREAVEWLPDKNEGEDISEESSEYTTLVDQLEEAIDALPDVTKSENDTICDVTLTVNNVTLLAVSYTGRVDGQKRPCKMFEEINSGSIKIQCICGSSITIIAQAGAQITSRNLINISEVEGFVYLPSSSKLQMGIYQIDINTDGDASLELYFNSNGFSGQ